MKRILIGALAGVAALAAWALPAPEVSSGAVADVLAPPAGTRAGAWFCPGADGEVDPILTAGVLSAGLVGFSLPVDGDILDGFQERTGPGVAEWDVGDGLFFHPGPAIVETSSRPAAATVLYRGPARLAADGCYVAAKEWFLNGTGIQSPATLTLRLFNPLLEPARVELEVVSEFGFEPLLDLETVGVGPRAWEDIELSLLLGDREQVAVRVAVTEGVVIPGLHAAGPNGLAVWPGESPSPTWEFPVAQVAGTAGVVSVWNPGDETAEVSLELAGRQGPVGRFELTVGPGREERFDVSGITAIEVGAVVRSSVAVVAALHAESPGARAASVGAPRPAVRWLVPGHSIAGDINSFVFVLNSGVDPVEVTSSAIGSEPGPAVQVAGGAIARLDVSGPGADVRASGPVSVAWLVSRAGEFGLTLGVPIAAATP